MSAFDPKRKRGAILGRGWKGTAALGIMMNLLLSLSAKGALREIEVVVILDSAAETAEKSKSVLGLKMEKLVAGHIRQMIQPFSDATTLGRQH